MISFTATAAVLIIPVLLLWGAVRIILRVWRVERTVWELEEHHTMPPLWICCVYLLLAAVGDVLERAGVRLLRWRIALWMYGARRQAEKELENDAA